jgi:protein-histidine pros-kinase
MTSGAQKFLVKRGYIEGKFLDFVETVPDAMILSDHQGRITLVNSNTEQMFGYSRDELMGKKVEILVPDRFRSRHRRDRAVYYSEPSVRPMGVGEVLCGCGKDGVEFPVEISLSPVEIRGSAFVWSAIRNINDRERSVAPLRAAIEKKLIDLESLISICAWCKRIHDGGASWQPLDVYIESHSKTKFTHGLCQDCLRKLEPVNH